MNKPKKINAFELLKNSNNKFFIGKGYKETYFYPAFEIDAWLDSKDNRFLTDLELHELQHACYDKGCENIAFSKDAEWCKKIENILERADDLEINVCDALTDLLYNKKEKVVCVSGYFNPLHVGHVRLFQAAKALGTKLVVVLNNDSQAIVKKGGIIINQDDRKELIEALRSVDECVIAVDTDKTVCETLKLVKPDIFANGGDRTSDNVPENKICEEYDIGMVYNVGGDKHDSSTDIIKRAKELER